MLEKQKKVEQYEKRFGAIAIEKGYIKSADLIDALSIQVKEEADTGFHRLIGAIFVDLDLLTTEQIEEIVNEVLSD